MSFFRLVISSLISQLIDVNSSTSLVVCDLVPASTYTIKVRLKPKNGMYYSDVTQTSVTTCSVGKVYTIDAYIAAISMS
jgi:hypothetical protein